MATPEDVEAWIARACDLTSRELEREVRALDLHALESGGAHEDGDVVFRCAGGGDEPGNRVTLCAWHHLRGVHAGRLRVSGRAPERLTYELGIRPDGARPLLTYASEEVV